MNLRPVIPIGGTGGSVDLGRRIGTNMALVNAGTELLLFIGLSVALVEEDGSTVLVEEDGTTMLIDG